MSEKSIKVVSEFETESAAQFVQKASSFESNILLKMDNKTANAKSIMGLISMMLTAGSEVVISATGNDSDKAIEELAAFLAR